MRFSAFAAFALAFSLLSGCASKPAVPDWVTGDSAKYTRAQYLIGRGQASAQEEAKDRARADIAKVFQVAVVASSEDVQSSKSDSTGAPQYEQQVSRSISTRTSQIIRGIQIAELWQDPATKTYYALAVLPRLQTAASLRQQIDQLDEATASAQEQRPVPENRRSQPGRGNRTGTRVVAKIPANRRSHRTGYGIKME